MRTPGALRSLVLFLIAIFVIAVTLLVGTSGLATAQHRPGGQTTENVAPSTSDAYAHWVYNGNTSTEITITLGVPVPLDLFINSGSNTDIDGQQSYLTFTNSLIEFVNAGQPSCVPTSTVQTDTTTFDAALQNEICNGPNSCTFRGQTVGPGSFAFASGGLNTCPQGCGGDFRVAHAAICGIAVGRAVLHWQFTPPAPISRDSEVVNVNSEQVQNPALYHDLNVNVIDCPSCPTVTPAPTYTPTSTFTVTPTPQPASPTPCAMGFTDVFVTDYFYDAVRYLYCEGAISGYSDGSFRPYNNTTRGQLSKIVTLAEGWSIDTSGGPHFSDVPAGSTFYSYVETAYHHGVISGYSDGTFRPNNNITRGQLSKIVVAAQGWQPICSSVPTFSDVPPSNPFYCYIEAAYCHGIISGYADGTFRWGNNATRGQISKIVYEAKVGGHACGSR